MKGNGRGGLEGPYDPIRPGKHSDQIESFLWKHRECFVEASIGMCIHYPCQNISILKRILYKENPGHFLKNRLIYYKNWNEKNK